MARSMTRTSTKQIMRFVFAPFLIVCIVACVAYVLGAHATRVAPERPESFVPIRLKVDRFDLCLPCTAGDFSTLGRTVRNEVVDNPIIEFDRGPFDTGTACYGAAGSIDLMSLSFPNPVAKATFDDIRDQIVEQFGEGQHGRIRLCKSCDIHQGSHAMFWRADNGWVLLMWTDSETPERVESGSLMMSSRSQFGLTKDWEFVK